MGEEIVWISAAIQTHLDKLKTTLSCRVRTDAAVQTGSAVVTNARHYEHLTGTDDALARAISGLDSGVTPDWLAMDLRVALQHLGELTGTLSQLTICWLLFLVSSVSESRRGKYEFNHPTLA